MPTYNKENRSKIENILLGRHDAQISQDKTKTPVPRISDIFGTPKSNTYNEILASICDDVREKTGYDSDADCSDFMTPYEINTEPYNYDTSDSNYTPQYLDLPDCPQTPEDVETQIQDVLTPYGIKYVRPRVTYESTITPEKFNEGEAFNWTKLEPNNYIIDEMVDYIVDNFTYEKDIPLTTYPNTKFTMSFDGSRIPNLGISTHEYKHVIELPVIQNLVYIYALNKFRKKKWENRVLDNKMRNKAELKKSIVKWLDKGKDQLLPLRDKLEKRRNQMNFMENEQTLGQHCFNNIPLIKQLYDEYLPWILNQ